jgi:hypothetical protein
MVIRSLGVNRSGTGLRGCHSGETGSVETRSGEHQHTVILDKPAKARSRIHFDF